MNKVLIAFLSLVVTFAIMNSAEAAKRNRHQRQQQTHVAPEARTGDMSKDANMSMNSEDKMSSHEMNHESNKESEHEVRNEKRDGNQNRN
jgi:hypothetical protein